MKTYIRFKQHKSLLLVFSHLGFWSGILFLIAPFPDLCLLVLFFQNIIQMKPQQKYRLGTISNIKLLGGGLKSILQAPKRIDNTSGALLKSVSIDIGQVCKLNYMHMQAKMVLIQHNFQCTNMRSSG